MRELTASQEIIAFILPPATALAGMRISRWILGKQFLTEFGLGFRLAFGLAIGMLVFSQAILMGAIVGLPLSALLAWVTFIWGGVELVLLAMKLPQSVKMIKFQRGHGWLLLLIPMLYYCWVFGRLSPLEGTLEFDSNAFWVFRAKILYLEQGQNFINTVRTPNLAYAHMDYPWLNAGIYAMGYGAVGGVDEFINKVWPFWMVVALAVAVLSLAKIWSQPHPLPIAVVTTICFLPGTLQFIRWEGGTIPLIFYVSIVALLAFKAMIDKNSFPFAAALMAMAGCTATKFEGSIYGVMWCFVLLPTIWKYSWFKERTIWRGAAAACICLLPFAIYRMLKPDYYELDNWWKGYATAWPTVVPDFFRALILYIPARFFKDSFYQWQVPDSSHGDLHWSGHWTGLGSLVNDQLAVLAWLLMILLVITFWKKNQRQALLSASAVMFGMMVFFTAVLAGVAYVESPVDNTMDFSSLFVAWTGSVMVGRYWYPFFIGWFLCTALLWFPNKAASSTQTAVVSEPKAAAALTPKPKKRR